MTDRPLLQAAAWYRWFLASAAIVNFGLFSLPWHGWGIVAEDVIGYLLLVAPIAFAAWHLAGGAAGYTELSSLIGVTVWGVVFGLVRLWGGTTGLPALLPIATDIAGV